MNFPMLYWFVPRGLVSLAKVILVVLLVLGFIWIVRSIRNSTPTGPGRRRRLALFFALFVLPVGGLLVSNEVMERRQIAESKAYVKAAWAHFKQRCETAHLTYFKQIEPQDGVFIMKPTQPPTIEQLRDQFWMGDPYDMPDSPENEAGELLYRKKTQPTGTPYAERGGFDFVEAPHPVEPGKYLRFTPKWQKKKNVDGYPIWDREATKLPEVVDTHLARYGYTWDDISTSEDRKYWVAGGRLRVVELATGEVVAERVGYVIERHFGATSSTFNQTPWSNSRGHEGTTCPDLRTRRIFLSNSLGTWNEFEPEGKSK